MPIAIRDCTLVPIPKGNKDPSISDNYRSIALASSLSKVLEWIILSEFSEFFVTNDLQFGYKKGVSTSLCTGLIKNIVSRYVQNGSPVYDCFLDTSKAFDLVDHTLLFKRLLDRKLPSPIVRFLLSWYKSQQMSVQMSVRWNGADSQKFSVANGIRQGGVLSPILFTVYIDELLSRLAKSGIGCHWGRHYAGAVQFIRFSRFKSVTCTACIEFGCKVLSFVDSVTHLGHIISYDLDDSDDIVRCANHMLRTFSCADCVVKTQLFRSFCLSL